MEKKSCNNHNFGKMYIEYNCNFSSPIIQLKLIIKTMKTNFEIRFKFEELNFERKDHQMRYKVQGLNFRKQLYT